MNTTLIGLWGLFIVQIIAVYFISRWTINKLFEFFRFFFHDDKHVFRLISVIFLPGTIVHEAAHLITAIILLLRVRSMNIFPQFTGNYIKLGSVEYEKKDAVRGILVGIAPILMGLIIFFTISYFKINSLLTVYIIFVVSSTMFSSQKDLQDLIVVIPVMVIIAAIFYIFNIKLEIIWDNNGLINQLVVIIREINLYLFFSMIIHISLIFILKWTNSLLNR